ncbi:hypothetical protein KFL_007330030 [Klebsormidium nitens]|uniref:ATP-dependent DNA helicase n=1 Tax=Klebsormidium nitens TaxID=105231 RepID=A0A1Y1INS5_KLENI|nr:hypothetical protein KFL_007330030 [Klebsormidium nitens]|eukprot:GAQ91139.1 hypothetical protein KFL_007330030 [Klebsormidium nitens]
MDSTNGRTRITIDLTDDDEVKTIVEPAGHSWKMSGVTEELSPASGSFKYSAVSLAGRNPRERDGAGSGPSCSQQEWPASGSPLNRAEGDPAGESSSPPVLSQEVRDRIARNKADALARRAAAMRKSAELPAGTSGQWQSAKRSSDLSFEQLGPPVNKRNGAAHGASTSTWEPPAPTEDVAEASKPRIILSAQQINVLETLRKRESVFLTGSAGTGKSELLKHAIKLMKSMYQDANVFVTASTGIAAVHINGTTLHSFAGIGLGKDSRATLVMKASRREAQQRWLRAKALICDEISMVDADFLDTLEYIARKVRRNEEPFGGIQLIFSGDFYQLPPVSKDGKKMFAFESDCWKKCIKLEMELTHVFRQEDEAFVKILNEVRTGQMSHGTIQALENCRGPPQGDLRDGVALTRLYPHNVDVKHENEMELRQLQTERVVYVAHDYSSSDFHKRMLDHFLAEQRLELCEGAQVMLLKNIEPLLGLCNGARGKVLGFTDATDPEEEAARTEHVKIVPHGRFPVVYFPNGGPLPPPEKDEKAQAKRPGMTKVIRPESWSSVEGSRVLVERTQIPLKLSWALSVHKCQGMTLDRVETDLTKAFEKGMCYVALSRVRSPEGLRLTGFDPRKVRVDEKVKTFYERLAEKGSRGG